jgi:hypothetical protein
VARRGEAEEWVGVTVPAYAAARRRHARNRADAFTTARAEAIERGLSGPELRFTDIDADALAVWRSTWLGRHPSGAGGWNGPSLVENLPRRAAVLSVAMWHGDDLCGLAIGHVSRRRWNGSRHTITLTHLERRPEPPRVELRGHILALAVVVVKGYAMIVGSRRLRLRAPDRNLLSYYYLHGFEAAWKGDMPLHCEKEIWP